MFADRKPNALVWLWLSLAIIVLDQLSNALPNQVRPLFVMLRPSDAERINWEMLCDGQDAFFALDERWPIARIIDPINAPPRLPCELTTPVRVMAVISAEQRSATPSASQPRRSTSSTEAAVSLRG